MNETMLPDHSGNPADEAAATPVPAPVPTPGARLATRRLELNMTVEQAASQLNLAPRQIHAIEADNFAALPGMASTRGFVRAYAKLLRMDATPLVEALAMETPEAEATLPLRRPISAAPFSDTRLNPIKHDKGPSALTLIFGLVVLLAAGLYIADRMGVISLPTDAISSSVDDGMKMITGSAKPKPGDEASDVSSSAKTGESTIDQQVLPPTVSSSSNDTPPAALPPEAPPVTVAGTAAAVTGAATGTPGSPPSGAALPAAVPNATVTPATEAIDPKEALAIKLREDSWIEIRRADSTTPVSRLYKAGTTETWRMTGPITLTIGNASGVDASLRGVPMKLRGDGKTNVARLNLK